MEVFVLLAGRPDDQSYLGDLKSLKGAMADSRDKLKFGEGSQTHRRGEYPTLSTGISYGGGSKVGSPPALQDYPGSP